MKQIKLFLVMLLSLVGMTAVAQQPTLTSLPDKPETSLKSGTDYLIAAGTSTDSYYFNVDEAKVNAPLGTAQIFTYTTSGNKKYLQRKSDGAYVSVDRGWFFGYYYTLTTSNSGQNMGISWDENAESARIIPNNYDCYIVSNGNNTDAAGVSTSSSYDWYFYKAAVVNITYYDETNKRNINTVTYVGRVGDVLTMPAISGYTMTSSESYRVNGSASVTINYINNAGEITEGTLANGRYYMASNLGSGYYISSMKSIVSAVTEARTFWSVWNVTKNVDGTYTIVNEGNNKVMTPCTDPEKAELTTDQGYLYYDSVKKAYFVGNVFDENNNPIENRHPNLTIDSSNNGYTISSEESKEGYYMAVDGDWKNYKDEQGILLQGDGCVKSIKDFTSSDNKTVAFRYWTFIPVDDNSTLYENGVQLLNGYVGGLTTMDIPKEDIEDLRPLQKVISKYKADKSSINAENAAVKYKEYVEAINAMRRKPSTEIFVQKLEQDRPFYVETIGHRDSYGNRMYYDASKTWKNTNVKEYEEDNPTNTDYVKTGTFYVEVINETNPVTVLDPAKGAEAENYPVTSNTCYYLKNAEDTPRYLARTETTPTYNGKSWKELGKTWAERVTNDTYKGKALSNVYIGSTTSASDSKLLKFIIVPIIPGVYQICDTEPAYAGDPFLTFNDEPALNHYRVSEVYSYFRFKTNNVFDYSIKKAGSDYVGSYGNILNSKIADSNITAYYIRAGKHSYNTDNTINVENATKEQMNENTDSWGVTWATDGKSTFTVYLDVVPDCKMQGMQGYILTGTKATQGKAATYSDNIASTPNDLRNNNMLHVALNSIKISTDTWGNYYDYFVLAYKSTDEVIGTWNKEDVKGMGLAFYHVKRGSYIPTGKCYLSTADLNAQLKKRYGDAWDIRYLIPYPEPESSSAARAAADSEEENVVPGFRIVFRDSNGVQTAIEEAPIIEVEDEAALDAISTLYSLDGRKVTAPKSGEVYILNGKKVMF